MLPFRQLTKIFTIHIHLSANELSDLKNFSPGVNKDNYTVTFPQHPCVILNALEVLGFRIVTSCPNGMNPDVTVWTLRKEFEDPIEEEQS